MRKRTEAMLRSRRVQRHGSNQDWNAYFRNVFSVCAEYLPPCEEIAELGVMAATAAQCNQAAQALLSECEEDLLDRHREELQEVLAGIEELEAHNDQETSLRIEALNTRLQVAVMKCASSDDSCSVCIVDILLDGTESDIEAVVLPQILHELQEQFSLTETHMRIIAALFSLSEIGRLPSLLHNSVSPFVAGRMLAEICGIDMQIFVRETMAGSRLANLGMLDCGRTRDEFADIELSRPLLFALRSNTLDDLRAGLFCETPACRYEIADFPLPETEIRNCTATISGNQALLLCGRPGIGKSEFARSIIRSLGRQSFSLSSMTDFPTSGRQTSKNLRLSAASLAANLLDPGRDVLIIDDIASRYDITPAAIERTA